MVLLYASKYHDIRTVVNVSGRYDLTRIADRLGEDFMEQIEKNGYIDVKDNNGEFSSFKSMLEEPVLLRICIFKHF